MSRCAAYPIVVAIRTASKINGVDNTMKAAVQKRLVATLFAVASLTIASVASAQETPTSPDKGATAQPTASIQQQQ